MGIMGLNLPTDIKWERFCVTQDMMAKGTCENDHPSNFSSSMALFKYEPEDEYQLYPGRKIVYLKLVCTITGYQPKDKQIEGEIDWNGINEGIKDNIEDLLNSYKPCTGALIQLTVGPPRGIRVDSKDYPYIMDYQPKKRELYEMATDTKERLSRSSNELAVGKSASSTNSREVLDVDQGSSGSSSFNVSYAGFGVGASGSQSKQGQWGTKDLSTQQSGLNRSTDESRERRESQSHTAQITNMYHLLDSYHLGTNRALFFIQPRPHILEEPTGFVNGPRGIEGIQEFFLVINQPKNLPHLCVSTRLDTGHYFTKDILDYDRSKTDNISISNAINAPLEEDPSKEAAGSVEVAVYDNIGAGLDTVVQFPCFIKKNTVEESYKSPWQDYKIDIGNRGGFDILPTSNYSNGFATINVAPDGESIKIISEASSHVCYEPSNTKDLFPHDPVEVYSGSCKTDLQINLISKEKIINVGKEQGMFITTRGLCCCPRVDVIPSGASDSPSHNETKDEHGIFQEGIVDIISLGCLYNENPGNGLYNNNKQQIPQSSNSQFTPDPNSSSTTNTLGKTSTQLGSNTAWRSTSIPAMSSADSPQQRQQQPILSGTTPSVNMTAREANVLSNAMRLAMFSSITSIRRTQLGKDSTLGLQFIQDNLLNRLAQTVVGRKLMRTTCANFLSPEISYKISQWFKKDIDKITYRDLLLINTSQLSKITGLNESSATYLKLNLLGIPFRNSSSNSKEQKLADEYQGKTRHKESDNDALRNMYDDANKK
jgi:hypothetical protein